jgi:UDP-N-acetylmuramate--alanine ligase
MDADHLDIYGNDDAIRDSFREFASKISDPKKLFIPKGLPLNGTTIAVNEAADYTAQHVRIVDGAYVFDVRKPSGAVIEGIRFPLPGKHNLMNALMALAMALEYGAPEDGIARALATFRGVRRRFSYQIRTDKRVYIDDYAHHPTEIDAVHQAVYELYPGRKVMAVFQPHLFSRTKDFADGFAKSLSGFDEVVLLDIYPARELPMEGITSDWLLGKIDNSNKKKVEKSALLSTMLASDADVFVTIGAGDIGEMVGDIKKALNEKA